MNILPALKQQKILLSAVAVVIVIIFCGSFVVSRQMKNSANTTGPSTQITTSPPNVKPLRTIDFMLVKTSQTGSSVTYVLQLGKNDDVIKSVGFKLKISGATALKSESSSFTSNQSLSSQGWQTAVNQTSQSSGDGSTIDFAILRMTPDQDAPTGTITLGEFTVELAEANKLPEFSLDENLSEAYTDSGEKLKARLVMVETSDLNSQR